jgi:hypothetical protein
MDYKKIKLLLPPVKKEKQRDSIFYPSVLPLEAILRAFVGTGERTCLLVWT